MPTDRIQYDLISTTGQFTAPMTNARNVVLQFDQSLGTLLNTEEVLNALGIKTQKQLQQEIDTRRELIKVLGTDQVGAVRTLEAQIEQLTLSQAQGAQAARQAEQALFSLGFIIDDTRQFTLGFDQGVRAIANNIQPFIAQLGRMEGGFGGLLAALKGRAGLIILFNTLVTAGVLVGEMLEDTSDKAAENAKKLSDLASAIKSVIRVEEDERQAREVNVKRLEEASQKYDGLTKSLKEQKAAFEEENRELRIAKTNLEDLGGNTDELTRQLDANKAAIDNLDRGITDFQNRLDGVNAALTEEKTRLQALEFALSEFGEEAKEAEGVLADLRQENRELTSALNEVTGAYGPQIAALRRQNTALERQIFLENALAAAQFARQQSLERADIIEPFSPLEGLLDLSPSEAFENNRQALLDSYRDFVEEMRALSEQFAEDNDRSARAAERFNQRINTALVGGFTSTIEGFAAGVGKGENVFLTLLETLAGLAVRVGRIIFLSGVGIESLKKSLISFTGVPAIAAGLALIAIGSAARAALSSAASSAGDRGAASGAGRLPGGRFDPFTGEIIRSNQGFLGSNRPPVLPGSRRVAAAFPGSTGGVGQAVHVTVDGIARGSDIHLTQKRVERRRGI